MKDKNTLFREKSLEKVNSPEQLDSYLKVASPSVWLVLSGIIILLIGVIVWGVYGKLETTITVGSYVEDKTIYCYFSEKDYGKIKKGHIIRVDEVNKEYVVDYVGYAGVVSASDSLEKYVSHLSDLNNGDFAYVASGACDLDDGSYKATLVLDSVSPLSFVFN